MTDEQLLLTPEQAAQRLGIGRTTLYALLSTGELPSVTIGRCRRVHRDSLIAYANTLEVRWSTRRHCGTVPSVQRRSVPRGEALGPCAERCTAEDCCRFRERS